MDAGANAPQEPPIALQQRSSRLTFNERSISPSTRGGRFRNSTSSPSPGPSSYRSPSSQRATSRSRLVGDSDINTANGFAKRGNNKFTNGSPSPTGNDDNGRATSKARKAARDFKVSKDVRARLPSAIARFAGWRDPAKGGPPYTVLPIPPFSWLKRLPLKYETWLLSTVGSFVSIALIEVIMSASFPNNGTILIVASFGASAVLCFGTIESPLAQPRHLVGGQVISAILAVCITKLFRLSPHYRIENTIVPRELDHIVWINAALSMALSLLAMQITGTVHPPGGATAIIASSQPAAVAMSWRFIYVVLISSLIMCIWACVINNVGRRRYPSYWFSGSKVFVRAPSGHGEKVEETQDQEEMEAEEGRAAMFGLSRVPEGESDFDESAQDERRRGRPTETTAVAR